MPNNFKINQYWIIALCILLGSLSSFAQELTDQEIRFDAVRETLSLQKRGIIDPEDLNQEISRMREIYKTQYLEMKQGQEEILQRIRSRQLLKSTEAIVDVSQGEKDALKAFYDSTNGTNWKNKTGWDFSTPVTSWNNTAKTGWYGITVVNGQVASLDLNTNNLTGFIPVEIGQLKYLKSLSLYSNNFVNTAIPEEIGNLTLLENLTMSSSKFNGNIPRGLYNLKLLKYLWIDDNQLTGELSPEIGNLKNLLRIYLKLNQLKGNIPSEIGQLSKLDIMEFTDNQFSGSLPPEIGQLSALTYMNFRNNQLTGSIPKELGQLKNLTSLYLTNNKLMGTIPPEIGLMAKVKWISLDYNLLSGNIPAEIGKMSLNYLYLNNNMLEGTIPYIAASYGLDVRFNKFRFIDFSSQFLLYKTKLSTKFTFSAQNKTDIAKTISFSVGASVSLTMFEDGRFSPEDTYQWYKNDVIINGATNRVYTITDLKETDIGTYTCKSYHTINPDMSLLVLEREPVILSVFSCVPLEGTIKSIFEKFDTNKESTFVFESTSPNLKYIWSVARASGEDMKNLGSNTKSMFSYKFVENGEYVVTLIVTDASGCSNTFTKNITVISRFCAKEAINFKFESSAAGLNYVWSAINADNVVVNTATNKTGLYTFIPDLAGEYLIKLTTDGTQNYETLFSKKINIEDCTQVSCTKTNLDSPKIESLFKALVSKLASLPLNTISNGYTCPELTALKPYIIDDNPAIYNFEKNDYWMSFSFTDHDEFDVQVSSQALAISKLNFDDYQSPVLLTKLYGDHYRAFVSRVRFCSYCASHVALVVDESGSIAMEEANKIKKQLKAFVLQQAETNDRIGSNVYVSLTGMSDSDENTRTDFIPPTKLSNTPASLNQFNTWIDNLGNRNGKTTGVSASSDYWRSGLEGALGYTMKPSMVIMITDGCQTADVSGLKATLKKFNNAPGSNPELPHLYVVGIEKGFYVDENFYVNQSSNQDQNSNQNLVNTVTTHLDKSLKYLFDFPETQFPKSDINQFNVGTYFGHTNFNLLASDQTYFSDKLINANIICGTPSIKDFCNDCLSFKPQPNNEYVLSAWVKEELFTQVKTYKNPTIKIIFYNSMEALDIRAHIIDSLSIKASGDIIDGWQRMVKKIKIPAKTITVGIQLENESPSIPVYFDDIRIYPLQGSVKSFVYDPETFKLMSELDENNYATFYEYDNEGGLVRVKKETEKGIKTIQETRSGSVINTKD